MDNIVLCGFMGCGKSTVGKNLARKTGRKFLDMDAYIEQKAGMRVSQIFEKYGESGFRDMEHNACMELCEMSELVIASGGGAFTFERNVEVFKGRDIIVLLDVPLETIEQRLKGDKTRPLLQKPDRAKVMKELYEKRLPLYRAAADITVCGKKTPLGTAFEIINKVNKSENP